MLALAQFAPVAEKRIEVIETLDTFGVGADSRLRPRQKTVSTTLLDSALSNMDCTKERSILILSNLRSRR